MYIKRSIQTGNIVIGSGGTTSTAYDKRGHPIVRLVMPAAFSGATVTFQVSQDNSIFVPLYDRYNFLVTVTVAVSRGYELPSELAGWGYFKVVSGSAEGADRTLAIDAEG